jgi:hypothetical protein
MLRICRPLSSYLIAPMSNHLLMSSRPLSPLGRTSSRKMLKIFLFCSSVKSLYRMARWIRDCTAMSRDVIRFVVNIIMPS